MSILNEQRLITMSQNEMKRIKIIGAVVEKRIKQKEAMKCLNLGGRQIIRLVEKYRVEGPEGLVLKSRGKTSNRKRSDEFKNNIQTIVSERYSDFGPTFAAEKLFELNGIKLNKETLRQWMNEWGLWKIKPRKILRLHQSRERRACFGELVQIDGSPHDWFEGRRTKCCLLVFIDDATSRLLGLRFEEQECSAGYFRLCRSTIKEHGRPLSYYSDKWSGFRQNMPDNEEEITQFGRVLADLDIELICAHSPEAKGRVERANQTLQDRLVKELRLRNINDIETANAYLPEFIKAYNKHFAVAARDAKDAHRHELPNEKTQDLIFSFQTERTVSKQLEIRYKTRLIQIQHPGEGYRLRHKKITVCESLAGEIQLLWENKKLHFTEGARKIRQPETVDRKGLEAKIDAIKTQQKTIPAPNHPWRKYKLTQKHKQAA